MTMLSFRVEQEDAADASEWAARLGIDRSQLLRDALHRHLIRLKSELDADRWREAPPTTGETSIREIADWGPAEDWSDWLDAQG